MHQLTCKLDATHHKIDAAHSVCFGGQGHSIPYRFTLPQLVSFSPRRVTENDAFRASKEQTKCFESVLQSIFANISATDFKQQLTVVLSVIKVCARLSTVNVQRNQIFFKCCTYIYFCRQVPSASFTWRDTGELSPESERVRFTCAAGRRRRGGATSPPGLEIGRSRQCQPFGLTQPAGTCKSNAPNVSIAIVFSNRRIIIIFPFTAKTASHLRCSHLYPA